MGEKNFLSITLFTNDYKFNILGVMGVKKFNYIQVFSSPF